MGQNRWVPLGATLIYTRPPVGRLIALAHAVWRVYGVADLPLTPKEQTGFELTGCIGNWSGTPFEMELDHVAGHIPPRDGFTGRVRTDRRPYLSPAPIHLYPESGRWPSCSCCGQPMPCQGEMTDRAVAAAAARLEKLTNRRPGDCWACGVRISKRQRTYTFDGPNADLPGGIAATFHIGIRTCLGAAQDYERRALAADPDRARVLTYPDCDGTLYVHYDRSSTCSRGQGQCLGHLEHEHRSFAACYRADGGCTRGCPSAGHPGTAHSERPSRIPKA